MTLLLINYWFESITMQCSHILFKFSDTNSLSNKSTAIFWTKKKYKYLTSFLERHSFNFTLLIFHFRVLRDSKDIRYVIHYASTPVVCTDSFSFSLLIFIFVFHDTRLLRDALCFKICSLYKHSFNFSLFIFIFVFRDMRKLRDSPAVSRY